MHGDRESASGSLILAQIKLGRIDLSNRDALDDLFAARGQGN